MSLPDTKGECGRRCDIPWSPKQEKVLKAKAHGWKPKGGGPFESVSEEKAEEMSKEGVKKTFPMKKSKKKKGKRASLASQLSAFKGK